jgi:hypothetical protein
MNKNRCIGVIPFASFNIPYILKEAITMNHHLKRVYDIIDQSPQDAEWKARAKLQAKKELPQMTPGLWWLLAIMVVILIASCFLPCGC